MSYLADWVAGCLFAAFWLAAPAWWPLLNAGGACLGRGIAWWMRGGPGWALARVQLERERRADAMADLLAYYRACRSEGGRRTRKWD